MTTTHTIPADDGVDLAVTTFGSEGATPVLLVHGYPDCGAVWHDVATRLADDHFVIVPDVRGAGDSGAPESLDAYAIEQLATDLRTVIDTLSPDRPVHVVGHDWGSVQSWEAVAGGALDGRLASFTSISGPCLDHVAKWARSLPKGPRAALARVRQALKSWYILALHSPFVGVAWRGLARRWPKVLERLEGIDAETRPPAPNLASDGANGARIYQANIRRRLRAPKDRTTDVPVQLVVAAADRFVSPDMADAALLHCSTVERVEVPDGHWGLLVKRPERCVELIADFVRRVDADDVGLGLRKISRFDGQVVVVTGAGSGIGRATAEAFAELGARVIAADISSEAAQRTAELIGLTGRSAVAMTVDVADETAMEAFAKEVLADHGVPDVVVNNAGIGMAGPFMETTTDDWRRILDVNLWGVIHGCRLFGKAMIERGQGGHIVNTASAAAFTPSKGLPAYATTKAAVLMLSECLRAELADESIGVSAICPGLISTNITSNTRFVGEDDEGEAEKQKTTTALYRRRNYTPEKVADAIVAAVSNNRAVVPVAPEAHALQALGRFAPRIARRAARRDLP